MLDWASTNTLELLSCLFRIHNTISPFNFIRPKPMHVILYQFITQYAPLIFHFNVRLHNITDRLDHFKCLLFFHPFWVHAYPQQYHRVRPHLPTCRIHWAVVQDCTCKHNVIDLSLFPYQKVILEYAPPFLQYSERTLCIFPHRFQSLTEADTSLIRWMLVWTLQNTPLVVASVAYKVKTGISLSLPDGIIQSELFVLIQSLRPYVLYGSVALTYRLVVSYAGMSNSQRSDASGMISYQWISYSRLAFLALM